MQMLNAKFAVMYVLLSMPYQILFGVDYAAVTYMIVVAGYLFYDAYKTRNEEEHPRFKFLFAHAHSVFEAYKKYHHLVSAEQSRNVRDAVQNLFWAVLPTIGVAVLALIEACTFIHDLWSMVDGQPPKMPVYLPMMTFILAWWCIPAYNVLVLRVARALTPHVKQMEEVTRIEV